MVIIDPDYLEEAFEGEVADIPLAIIPSTGKISLLQMDGIVTRDDLKSAMTLGLKAAEKIYEIQKKALKEKYTGDHNE